MAIGAGEQPRNGLRLTGAIWWTAGLLILLSAYVYWIALPCLPMLNFVTEDGPAAAIFIAGLLLTRTKVVPFTASGWLAMAADRRVVLVTAILIAIGAWVATYWLLKNYGMTRDEQMATFDAAIFRTGRLAMPVAPQWRAFVPALAPDFLLDFAGDRAWASAYLPGNAAARALASWVIDPALLNPLLAGTGLLALAFIVRRLFPADRAAQGVVLLFYATSSQIWFAAMTPYAMTGHLALNLYWLALFLRGGRTGHGVAGVVGFVTTGWHQIIFHPLFVAPFLAELARARRWSVLGWYVAVYTAAGLFWMSYQGIAAASVDAMPAIGPGTGLTGFLRDRVLPLLMEHDGGTVFFMAENLLRFLTWQNLALFPLALLGIRAVRKGEGIARPLYFGLIFTAAAMFVLLPYQGHGYGYRYLHGLIGSAAILAGYGWQRVDNEHRKTAGRLIAIGALLAVPVALFLGAQARAYEKPFADLSAAVGRVAADFVVIDDRSIMFSVDLVRNAPSLTNRPLRFAAHAVTPQQMSDLCARGTVAFVSRAAMAGIADSMEPGTVEFDQLVNTAKMTRCQMTVLTAPMTS